MSTKEQLDNINATVYEKLNVDNPLYRYPSRGETIGFYTVNDSLSPKKSTLKATHNLFYAMNILANSNTYPAKDVLQSIKVLKASLEIILDNIKELDPDIIKLIHEFLKNSENKKFINRALNKCPILFSMSVTKKEIYSLTELLHKNGEIFSEANPALKLAKL